MQENADQNNPEYRHLLRSVLEMDWKNFEKDRKSFGIVLKIWQNSTCRLAAFLETLHAAMILRRFPCILRKQLILQELVLQTFRNIHFYMIQLIDFQKQQCTLKILEKSLKTVFNETCPFTSRSTSKKSLSFRHTSIALVCIFASILRFYAHIFDSKPMFVYLNPQVRINKMVDKHLKQQFSYFYQLLEFSLKPVYFTMVGKNFHFYGVQISRKCIEPMHFYTWSPPQ